MKIPSSTEAHLLLKEAGELNPGPWVQHSINVAKAARIIAEKHPRLDADVAYVLGLLHDIGRREGRFLSRHIMDGYSFLLNLGYDDSARICLTHCFVIPNLNAYPGEFDCTPQELEFIRDYISSIKFTEYDLLIQLCDGISLPSGFCLLEKRMIDVAMRLGISDKTIPSWEARFRIKEMFENTIGCSIYQILPGIIESTFGVNILGG
jgi:hypothetical protein